MILSIESSCDDSSIAITEIASAKLLFHQKISQDSAHSQHGGVVPEIASRLHAKDLPLILARAKEFLEGLGGEDFSEVDSSKGFGKKDSEEADSGGLARLKAIAITTEPGLSVSLIEGLMMAKALALSLKIPLISVNHLIGHFYSLFIDKPRAIFPMGALLVSGGHTQIICAHSPTDFEIIAQSMDDSFGESFDKVAKMLGLGYPGGPIIERYARLYEAGALESGASESSAASLQNPPLANLPVPLKNKRELAFSFSGLKNATRLLIDSLESKNASESTKPAESNGLAESKVLVESPESRGLVESKNSPLCSPESSTQTLTDSDKAFVSASFQHAAIAHICDKLERYFRQIKGNKKGTTREKSREKIDSASADSIDSASADSIGANHAESTSAAYFSDFAIIGGASSNLALRSAIRALCEKYGMRLHLAPLEFCADNAAMIGRAGIEDFLAKRFADTIAQEISPRTTTPFLHT